MITWPESQEWMDVDGVEFGMDDMTVFVPEELIDGEE